MTAVNIESGVKRPRVPVQVTVRGSLSRLNPTPYQIYCQSSLGPLVKGADAGTINQARPRVLHLGKSHGPLSSVGTNAKEFPVVVIPWGQSPHEGP